MKGDIVYYAVYKNGQHYCGKDWNEISKDASVWFFLKSECIVQYAYGNHYSFCILDCNMQPSVFSIGNFDVLGFYKGGTQTDYYIEVKFKDKRTSYLYTHKIYHWEYNGEILAVLNLVKDIDRCGSYDLFILRQENKALKEEIERLKNA